MSIRTRKNPAASNTHPHQKSFFLSMETPYMDLRAGPTRKVIRRTSRLCNPQNTHAPPRRDRGCQNTCLYIPLAYVLRSVLSHEHWRMALSKLGRIMLERTKRMGQAWAVLSYYTDQLMTPCSKSLSGGSTLNRTSGGDRWARVLCGKIGWLSELLHRIDADCSGCTNLKMKTQGKKTEKQSRLTENTPRKPQQPGDRDQLETACDETRPTRSPTLARFHGSRVCGNRPRTALANIENDECHTYTQAD